MTGATHGFCFLHAADLHLDSPMRGLARQPDAPIERLRGATRAALKNVVDLAIERDVAFVVLAGDLYDGDWPDYHTGLFFVGQLQRLVQHDIAVFMVYGNHDAASQITRSLTLPEGVVVFGTEAATTAAVPGVPAVVHGRSYGRRDETRNLAVEYPDAQPGVLNVGLLHTALGGAPGHAHYAPCSLEDLSSKGYHYWALGHVHTHHVVQTDPHVVFSGNTQARHAGETGPKGCVIVHADAHGVSDVEFVETDTVRWARIELTAEPDATAGAVIQAATEAIAEAIDDADGRLLTARVTVSGRTLAHKELSSRPDHWAAELRAAALGAGDTWLERISWRTEPLIDHAAAAARDDALGGLLKRIDTLSKRPDTLRQWVERDSDLWKKLPPSLHGRGTESGQATTDVLSDSALRAALEGARDRLVGDLLHSEADT